MLKQIVWFTIGYSVAKVTEHTPSGKKIKGVLQKLKEVIKEEFREKDVEGAS